MVQIPIDQWVTLAWLFVLGSVVGSFLNVCIYRIPDHEVLWPQLRGLVSPPSRCPACGCGIRRFDNIPIFGWLRLGGRCRNCRAAISARYPLIELLNGLLFALLYLYELPVGLDTRFSDNPFYASSGLDVRGMSMTYQTILLHARYAYHLVLIDALIVATFIDIDLRIIPDGCTIPAMFVGVLGGWAFGRFHLAPLWYQDPSVLSTLKTILPETWAPLLEGPAIPAWIAGHPHWHGLAVSLAGFLVGGGAIWTVRLVGKWVLRQEAMGFGDVTLMAMIGSFIGWQPVLAVFFLAPLCALVVVSVSWVFRREREVPYGPYLSLGTLIVLFGWNKIWPILEHVFETGPLVPLFGLFMVVMLVVTLQMIQLVKRLLGIPLYPPEWNEEWTSADQLSFFAGKKVDPHQGCWRTDRWPGSDSGRGAVHEQRWRDGRPDE